MATHPWLPWAPVIFGIERGVYKKLNMDLKPAYHPEYNEMVNAVASGKVDFGFCMLGDAVKARAQGKAIKVISETNWSNGGDKIIIRATLKSMADLKGKKVAADKGTVSYYFLLASLKKFKLSEKDVTIVQMTAEQAAAAAAKGIVDAAVTWEPDAGKAIATGKVKTGFTTRQLPGIMPEVVIVREALVKSDRQAVVTFLKGWIPSLDLAMKDKAGFLKNANLNGFRDNPFTSVAALNASLADVSIHNANTIKTRFSGPSQAYAKAYLPYLISQKVINKPFDTSALFAADVVKTAMP